MNALQFPVGLCLLALVVAASWTDLRARRIPNALVLTAVAIALPVQCWLHGWGEGFHAWWSGLLTGGGFLLPMYLLRAMGAGDVKLMAAVGALTGAAVAFRIALLTFIVGGIWSLAAIVAGRKVKPALANLGSMLRACIGHVSAAHQEQKAGDGASVGSLPFAVAIALGTVGGMALQTAGVPFGMPL